MIDLALIASGEHLANLMSRRLSWRWTGTQGVRVLNQRTAARRSILAFVSILFLAGCNAAPLSYRDFTGQGRGVPQLQMDGAVCQMAADNAYRDQIATGPSSSPSLAIATVGEALTFKQNTFDLCMRGGGWEQVEKTQNSVMNSSSATVKEIGRYDDWKAATFSEAGQTVCYAFTRARASTPALPGRGEVLLTVTHRQNARDGVSLGPGFTYAAGATVTVQAGAAVLSFYAAQRSAFARDGHASVAAFQNAYSAIANNSGPKGTVTDTFSLKGFVGAYAVITKVCPQL